MEIVLLKIDKNSFFCYKKYYWEISMVFIGYSSVWFRDKLYYTKTMYRIFGLGTG